jgi:hypothetical protein
MTARISGDRFLPLDRSLVGGTTGYGVSSAVALALDTGLLHLPVTSSQIPHLIAAGRSFLTVNAAAGTGLGLFISRELPGMAFR